MISTESRHVNRLRTDTFSDYLSIIKSFVWDDPVEIDQGVYLGNISHSFFRNTLDSFNINAIVNVTGEVPNYYELDKKYFTIRIEDLHGATIHDQLEASYQFICQQLYYGNVLIHCKFGRSRSVAVCVYYLIRKYNLSFEEAYQRIQNLKPSVNLNIKFANEIKEKST